MTPARARILLVDDEAPILRTASEILRQDNFDVDEAEDGFSALAAIEHTSYDLVLTDLKMDGMDGLMLLSEVQKKSPQTATVMMTGYGTVESAIEAVRSGAYEFLMKPVAPQELREAVQRCLERKRLSEIDTLYHVGNEIAAAETANEVQEVVLNAVKRVLGAVNVAWISADREGNVRPEKAQRQVFTAGNLKSLLSQQVVEGRGSGQEGAALVPGLANGKLIGVLYVDHGGEPFDYHASCQRFLAALARDAAMALDRLSLIEELKQNNSTLAAANRRLQELDVLKSQFLSVATHELRTPLSIILGYNTMIEESAEERLTAEE
ncbi:MAG TPA: response regulator, partial [Terriglobales bacterium]